MPFLKWLFARDEMIELERWRTAMTEYRRWLAAHPDIAFALRHLESEALGLSTTGERVNGEREYALSIPRVRENIQRNIDARRAADMAMRQAEIEAMKASA